MDYQLLDCGNGYKIERFGKYILARPEPQAIWLLERDLAYWSENVDAFFERRKAEVISNREDSGQWIIQSKMPTSFNISLGKFGKRALSAKLSLTSFKHVGIFPEQYSNWQFLDKAIREMDLSHPLLNVFAYTGIASSVAANCNIPVVHVDSVKQVVSWANENRVLSDIPPKISWVVEDALKFMRREVGRNKQYSAIVLDPPAYGRGANGEKWLLEHDLFELLSLAKKLLLPKNSFLVLNVYSMNITPKLLQNILLEAGLWTKDSEVFEQTIPYRNGERFLPLGVCARVLNF